MRYEGNQFRNSWWTLFCEDVSRSQKQSNEFPSHIDKVISQLYVHCIDDEWWISERYESDHQVLSEQSFSEGNLH